MRFEQAVYGSFPFWNRGYGVLAHSPGCRPEWLAELRAVCQRDGEPPAGVTDVKARFALRLQSGPWLVAGVSSQGCDDRGRPGALAFHAIFVGRFAYRWIGANPFVFEPAIRGAWSATDQDRPLPRGRLKLNYSTRQTAGDDDDPRLPSILRAVAGRRRVIVQSSTPIDALARTVWSRLPARTRMRASLATWAFDTANAFDLVAVPKLTGLVCDPTDLIVSSRAGRSLSAGPSCSVAPVEDTLESNVNS